jgi:hypothetical protein
VSERPESFEGAVTIEWQAADAGTLPGWRFWISDGDGTVIPTVTGLVLHVDAENATWAEVTMFADAAGRPDCTGQPLNVHDGEAVTGTFPFLVANMGVREKAGAR